MQYVYIGFAFVIVLIVVVYYINRKRLIMIYALIEECVKKENESYEIRLVKEKGYEIEVIIESRKYLIKILKVPQKPIVITNKDTWIINDHGQVLLKNQIVSMKHFMNIKTNDHTFKIVVVYPQITKMLKYINEHEMVFIDSNAIVYDALIVNFRNINADIFSNH